MWQFLANAHDADEDRAAALSCWQRVVELNPTFAPGHKHLGRALQQEGRFAEAAACYLRALELQPQYIDALLNSGGLHEELGDMAEAEAWYRRTQAHYPRAPGPLARLALLFRGKLPEVDRDAIEAQLGRSDCGRATDRSLPPRSPARRSLLFGLAQVLDAQGAYAAAADCLEQANSLALEQRRKQGKHYNPDKHAALVDRIIAGFTPQLFDRPGPGPATTPGKPVFVFGLPRSGTTLVEQVLASHSRIHGAPGELGLAHAEFVSIPELLGRPDEMLPCLEVLDAGAVRQLSLRHRDGLEALLRTLPADGAGAAKDRIVDKLPDNYLYLGLVALLFLRATFVHVRRDLRAVAVSCWMTQFRDIRWADDLDHLAGRCRDYARLMQYCALVLPVPVHEVVYEQLVEDFQTEARRLLAVCGLDWEPACGRFHQTVRPVQTASVTQVRQSLYRRSLARWKHYEATFADLFARLPAE